MEDPKQSAAAFERITQFLKDFVPDQGSPTGEENLNIQLRSSIVGSYRLSQTDLYPEVLDWVTSYLDQKKCPSELSVILSTEVGTIIKESFPIDVNEQDPEAEFLLDSILLYNNVLETLVELCNKYKNTPDEIITKTKTLPHPPHLTSVNAIKNSRRKMEDRHVVIPDLNTLCGLEKSPRHSYYAIFDGHAGVDAASYAASHLHWNIVKHPAFATDLELAIKEAYVQTDELFIERSKRDNIKSGCTAVTCIMRDNTLYVAWLGDSLAILVRQGMPISLVEPHKPDKLEERQRIEQMGGLVSYVGTWRVNGTLAVSRAIGDIEHKPVVISTPDILKIPLQGDEDFLVIGCDGLWDNMSPHDVSAAVYSKATDLTSDPESIASCIVQQSKNQGSTDNITAIVILLRDRASLTQPLPPSQAQKNHIGAFDHFSSNGKMDSNEFPTEGPFSNNPFSQNWMDNPTESLESGKSIYVYNSGITVGDPIGANGPEEIFRPFTGVTLERTSISELPTPPIEEVTPSQQFANLESMRLEAQSSNPFGDVTDFLQYIQVDDIASNIINSTVESANTQSQNVLDLLQELSHADTLAENMESQNVVLVDSQGGQSHLTAVPENEGLVPSSKPWMMQVEHSLNQNEIDYLPNAESSDLLGANVDFTETSQSNQLYDFSGTMQLEDVPLNVGDEKPQFDPLQQVDIPVGSEIETSYRETEDIVSSLSEEAPSTLRAIHGIQEMIGISESVPGSKAQDPPATTTGNPFSDNPFSVQKTFDENLVEVPALQDSNDTLTDLRNSVPDIHHESLIESNVDPQEDELSEQEAIEVLSNASGLPDVLLPTLENAETRDLNSPDNMNFFDVGLKKEETVMAAVDLTPEVPIEPTKASSDVLATEVETEHTLPPAPTDLLVPNMEFTNSPFDATELINTQATTTSDIHVVQEKEATVIADSWASEANLMESTGSVLKQDSHADTLKMTIDPVSVNHLIEEDSKVEVVSENPIGTVESSEEILSSSLGSQSPLLSLEVNNEILSLSKDTIKDDLPLAFPTQSEAVKVEFSPTLSSEPTMAILSPLIGSPPVPELSSTQDIGTLNAPAVQLGKIPDGVPEADGVTEDVDSDSEKDGGWSYVKGTDGKMVEKKEDKAAKSPIKQPVIKPTESTTITKKAMGTKESAKPLTSTVGLSKTSKPETKTNAASAKAGSSTLAKKAPATQSTDTTKKSTTVRSAPTSSKPLKIDSNKTGATLTASPRSSKPPSTLSAAPKVTSPAMVKKTTSSTLKSTSVSSTKTMSSSSPSKPITKPPATSKPTLTNGASTLNKTSRPATAPSMAKVAPSTAKPPAIKAAAPKTIGTIKVAVTKSTPVSNPTLTKSATSATKTVSSTMTRTVSSSTRTASATAARTVTTTSKVTKKPDVSPSLTIKSPAEPKQAKETVNKQLTRQTGTMGKTTSSTLTKTSNTRTTTKSVSDTSKSKPNTAKPNTGTKSVTRPVSNKGAVTLVNGNAEGLSKEAADQKDMPKSVAENPSKASESIHPPVEAEKGALEESNKEMPAVDSGLASPESLESPQNGLVGGDSNVTNNPSMQNDKNEMVINQ